ncbi:MAG TPA: hypothetical protein VNW99_13655 [Cytophagaceae bacterium]|jgi:hypothetical protein|nr:hypothetical protein [Cytophagaceae bacterium]
MRNKIFLLLFLFTIIIFYSCKKQAGKGGNHTVSGKVVARKYDLTTHPGTYTSPAYNAENEEVYIIYGDDITFGDHQKTNQDGSFEFKYLNKGNYKVYAYSKDSTNSNPSGKIAITKDLVIGSEKTIVVPEIDILR